MTFLQYVAKDLLAKHTKDELANIAVVFPNKRASMFLNKALFEEAGKPVWSPAYITISDLFRRHSAFSVPDQIDLVFRLYNTYCAVTGSTEPLDHFYSWGQLMLSDFEDIDKNLVDADKLFINLEAWQEMKDYSFLSEKQRQSLEAFFGKMVQETELQQRFNDTWKHLKTIYHTFRASLQRDGLAYEGMLYRQVVEETIGNLQYDKYVFVGFNLLQKVEQQLFKQIKEQGKAEFYWDYDTYYMSEHHEAGKYIKQYLGIFPNELSSQRASADIDTNEIYNNLSNAKDISFVSATTEDIQARYVTTWLNERLSKVGEHAKEEANDIAIVLADEHLLQNVIHAIPAKAGDVNITTGYPLSASPVATLVDHLLCLQMYGVCNDRKHFKLQYVNKVLRHPFAKFLSEQSQQLYSQLNEHKTFYPSCQALTEDKDEVFGLIFQPLSQDNAQFPVLPWIAEILRYVGLGARYCGDVLTQEAIFRMYTLMQRMDSLMTVTISAKQGLHEGKQLVSTNILIRLLRQLVDTATIPFHGEPARGIQVMGVLETRNLDFKHILLLSANEGNIPRGVDDASFIPHSLRQGYEMTTIENKVAIYSYYFHSLLQRAGDIAMTYNISTDGGSKGEMSRFMLQFMVENSDKNISFLTLQSGQSVMNNKRMCVEKTGVVAERLNDLKSLSPTALGRYLRCNLQFYYNIICGLKEQDDYDEDEIDNATFGNIFHRTAELIYEHLSGEKHQHTVDRSMLEALIADQSVIERFLDQAFREKLFKVEDPQFHPTYNGLQLLNRNVIRLYINRLLKCDMQVTPFHILALETSFYDQMTIAANGEKRQIVLGGQIDRLDIVKAATRPNPSTIAANDGAMIRVVDYKTGKPLDGNPPTVEDIFNPAYVDTKHSVYYLQAFLYASIIRRGQNNGLPERAKGLPVAPALLFIREAGKDEYNPILKIKESNENRAKKVVVADINDVYDEYTDGLKSLLQEIFDVNTPFRPTEDTKRCENCPYKYICKA